MAKKVIDLLGTRCEECDEGRMELPDTVSCTHCTHVDDRHREIEIEDKPTPENPRETNCWVGDSEMVWFGEGDPPSKEEWKRERELTEARNEEFLGDVAEIEKYVSEHGHRYEPPEDLSHGRTTIPVLEFLWNKPLNNLTLAYVHALRPSMIRVTEGVVTCDSWSERVTIFVDRPSAAPAVVRRIEMEVGVLGGTGYDVEVAFAKAYNVTPEGYVVRHYPLSDKERKQAQQDGSLRMSWPKGFRNGR